MTTTEPTRQPTSPGTRQLPPTSPIPRQLVWWLVATQLAALPITGVGCHRAYYRKQADAEVSSLVVEKAGHPHWPLDNFSIDIDPRSRMFDPFNPDCEPMPPDDPESHALMQCVDNKPGFPHWDDNGQTAEVQNPYFLEYLPRDDEGNVTLDETSAVRMALLNSPDYQRELEDLFLSALDVSAERFRFDTQFFGGLETSYETRGRDRPDGPASLFNVATRNVALQKTFTTGAEMMVGLANSLVWQFSGPDNTTAIKLLDFSLIQPLLRRAGRDRIMETLTLSERTLLANVRQMERFRRGFQLEIITGTGGTAGPSRRGGLFGGSGLTGFTGVGGGGFGGIGTSGGGTSGAVGAAQAGGFLGLLQEQQNIRNLETNITSLRSSLAQLEAFRDAGRIDLFQVDQARQDLFQQQSALLNAKNNYQNSLDFLKADLGLPPELSIRIADSTLNQFNLIDPAIIPLQNQVADLQQLTGRVVVALIPEINEGDGQQLPALVWSERMADQLRELASLLGRIDQLQVQMLERNVPRVQRDIGLLEAAIPQRRRELQDIQVRLSTALQSHDVDRGDAPNRNQNLDDTAFGADRIARLSLSLRDETVGLQQQLNREAATRRATISEIEGLIRDGPNLSAQDLVQALVDRIFIPVPSTLMQFSDRVLELSLIQARARTETITLVPVKMDSATAIDIARVYRRDWMNARAQLVDAWRLIEFNADNLESDLDIVFNGDFGHVGDNPVKLRSSYGSLRVGMRWDGPFTRLLERNVYRESLIDYQQARRSYYRFEDGVALGLRQTLRQIDLNQVNFELRRAAVEVAVRQVQLARLQLQEPPRPGEIQTFGPTTARNLVDALSALRIAQDAFLSVWVNYEVQRRVLDLNLGTLQLDSEGAWVDPGPIGYEFGYPRLEAVQQDSAALWMPPTEPAAELIAPGPRDTLPADE